ncbi:hypothetical protein [Brazilian marseillevirus]|uniref:hypothetical protein n=1 Tax=Brazilian marseillevirus TaxID=1813599 RepID=UPI0007845155|nr:hypothetical protein A3303_gp271 [Brazilian marseillevirus]AMQ10779.1 hypothetical protein [Brazilian marseillevirus]
MERDEYEDQSDQDLFSEEEESSAEEVSDEEEEASEFEEEEKKRFERELERELEEREEQVEIQEEEAIIPGTKKDEELVLAEEEAERQADRLRRLGYDVEVVPIGVGTEPGAEKAGKSAATGRLGYSAAEKKLLGIQDVKKTGRVTTERVSTKKTKTAAKRKGAVRAMIGKSERTVYGAKRVGTVRLVGTHLEEDVDVYKLEEKPYDRFVKLVKTWEERYAAGETEDKPISRASIPTISRVVKDEEKSKKRRVYDIPITYRDFAILQRRSDDIQKILEEVKEQRKRLTKEKIPEAGGRLRFPKPEERVKLSEKQRERMDKLVREIFEAAEEARDSLAPRTEAGKFLLERLESIGERREDAEKLRGKEKKELLQKLEKEEQEARDEAVLLRTRLASTMGIAPKKRGTILVGAEIKQRGKASRSSPTKKTDFALAAWKKSKTRDQKTREFARQIFGELLNDEDIVPRERDLDRYSDTTKDYVRRLAILQLLFNTKSSVSKASQRYHETYDPSESDVIKASEEDLLPELLYGPQSKEFKEFLRKRENALIKVIRENEKWDRTLLRQLPQPGKFEALEEDEGFKKQILLSMSPSEDVREAVRDISKKLAPKFKVSDLEKSLFKASKTSSLVSTRYYLHRLSLVLALLTKTLSGKSPYLTAKLDSGLYKMRAIGLIPEDELAPEYLFDEELRPQFLEHKKKVFESFVEMVVAHVRGEKKNIKFPTGASLPFPPKLQEKCSNPDSLDIELGNIVMCYADGVFHCYDVEKEIKSYIRKGKPLGMKLPQEFEKKMRERYSK